MNQTFVVEQHQSALAHDQTVDRSPITMAVRSTTEIDRAFNDVQTSRKAAAFLRMLKHATNDTIFQQSLVRYLKHNRYARWPWNYHGGKCATVPSVWSLGRRHIRKCDVLISYVSFRVRYGTAEPDQLFEAFELTLAKYQLDFGHGQVTVTEFMKHWTEQAGYPAINVTKVNGSFIVKQVCIGVGK